MQIHQSEAETIRAVVGWIVEDGLTTGEACGRLNVAGHLTRHGRQWQHQNLRRILTQRVLVGEIVWANTAKTHRSYTPSGRFGGPVTLRFEPIISEEAFSTLQKTLAIRAHGRKQQAKPYPLSGRLTCHCGEPYGGVWRRDRDLRQYRCRAARWTATDEPRCRARRIDAGWVEDVVWNEVVALLSQPDRLLSCVHDYLGLRTGQVAVERDESEAIEANVARLERGLNRARKNALLDDDPDAYAQLILELRDELESARRQHDMLRAWRKESAQEAGRIRSMWDLAEAAADRLPAMSDEEKTEVLGILGIRVTVLDPPPDAPARGGRRGGHGPGKPRLRIEGSLPHQQLLDAFVPGNLGVAGSRARAPRVTSSIAFKVTVSAA